MERETASSGTRVVGTAVYWAGLAGWLLPLLLPISPRVAFVSARVSFVVAAPIPVIALVRIFVARASQTGEPR